MRRPKGRLAIALWVLVPIQLASMVFFIWDICAGLLGLRTTPISWQTRELIELLAALGLVLGFAVGAVALAVTMRRNRAVEAKLRAASAAFTSLLEERFTQWRLTPAERDVAWFTIKGFSIAEIAALRETSEGTVKAQSNAIYRKAGVSSRAQLVTMFIEDLMEDGAPPPAAAAGPLPEDAISSR